MSRSLLTVDDARGAAQRRLPRMIFEYIDRGTEREAAVADLRRGFEGLKLRPAALVDVSAQSTEATILGERCAFPLIAAPTAFSALVWRDGEIALAKAAAAARIPYCIATHSTVAMERIAREAAGSLWFQLYMWRRRDLSYALLDRARAVGVETLLLTVDTPVSPKRSHNVRNGFSVPVRPTVAGAWDVATHPRWAFDVLLRTALARGFPDLVHRPAALHRRNRPSPSVLQDVLVAADLTWDDVSALRDRWPGKLLLKGVMRTEEAAKAVGHGVDGIVVSNHGGRNFDSSLTPLSVLADIAREVGRKLTVLADGGVWYGSDILKLLACGAAGVLAGRSLLYGTAAAGQEGAARVIGILRAELGAAMAMCGCRTAEEIDATILYR